MFTPEIHVGRPKYEGLLAQAVMSDFAASVQIEARQTTTDRVTAEFIGSKNTRQGARPDAASEYFIRNVVNVYVEQNRPIPTLITSAAIKMPIGEAHGPDLAEVLSLRMLADLNRRIRLHYEPGLAFRIRMQDVTERVISDDVPNLTKSMEVYLKGYRAMVDALEMTSDVEIKTESSLASESTVMAHAYMATPAFLTYLKDSAGEPMQAHAHLQSYKNLQAYGWEGIISPELRAFFAKRFAANYQNFSDDTNDLLVAKYLACIAATYKYKANGMDPAWNLGALRVAFYPPNSPPLPGADRPTTFTYMRTMPRNMSSNHLAPWVARAAICNTADGARVRLLNWHDQRPLETTEMKIISAGGEATFTVAIEGGV